jgi:hypothetical protein
VRVTRRPAERSASSVVLSAAADVSVSLDNRRAGLGVAGGLPVGADVAALAVARGVGEGTLGLDCLAGTGIGLPGIAVGPISSARRNSDARVSAHAESRDPATINAAMVYRARAGRGWTR